MSQILCINNNDPRIMYNGNWNQSEEYASTATRDLSLLKILFQGTINI